MKYKTVKAQRNCAFCTVCWCLSFPSHPLTRSFAQTSGNSCIIHKVLLARRWGLSEGSLTCVILCLDLALIFYSASPNPAV